MSLLNKLRDLLGLESSESSSEDRDVGVTVEREGSARHDEEPATSAESDGGAQSEGGEDASVGEDGTPTADDDESSGDDGDESRVPSEAVDVVKGIGPTYAERLSNAGIETVADLAEADAADVADRADVPEGRLEDWIERAKARAR